MWHRGETLRPNGENAPEHPPPPTVVTDAHSPLRCAVGLWAGALGSSPSLCRPEPEGERGGLRQTRLRRRVCWRHDAAAVRISSPAPSPFAFYGCGHDRARSSTEESHGGQPLCLRPVARRRCEGGRGGAPLTARHHACPCRFRPGRGRCGEVEGHSERRRAATFGHDAAVSLATAPTYPAPVHPFLPSLGSHDASERAAGQSVQGEGPVHHAHGVLGNAHWDEAGGAAGREAEGLPPRVEHRLDGEHHTLQLAPLGGRLANSHRRISQPPSVQ